ncbi:hypothetical protein P7C70_g7944, partial [Phenoliferia sp. Uapishka_3]
MPHGAYYNQGFKKVTPLPMHLVCGPLESPSHIVEEMRQSVADAERFPMQGDVAGRAPRRAAVARDTVSDKIQPPEATSRLHPLYRWPTTRIVKESHIWYQFDFKAGWCTPVEAAYWKYFIESEDMMDHQGVRWVTWKKTWQLKGWASIALMEQWKAEQAAGWETITID